MREKTGGSLKFEIDAITVEEDRVAIEARSTTTLVIGAAYANAYVFVLRLREGRIAAVREHYNDAVLMTAPLPLMQG